MRGRAESSMTGSMNGRPPVRKEPLLFCPHHQQYQQYTTAKHPRFLPSPTTMQTTSDAQPIQLTPLWEHVVRTRKFPSEVDARATFVEISARLRDPEWEVRQHALRVLVDVLPTLGSELLDRVMQPVLPELVNNLGHPAPAVRKGALDTLRVYLLHCKSRDQIVHNILDSLNHSDGRDNFHADVTSGIILSAPSLLFPISRNDRPSSDTIRDAVNALASRLIQATQQEVVVKSLAKIRDAIGSEKFNKYLLDHDERIAKHFQALCDVYSIRSSPVLDAKKTSEELTKKGIKEYEDDEDVSWGSDSDTSGIVEEDDVAVDDAIPPSRVVLETEIKFDQETAITMTILEEKVEKQDDVIGTEAADKDATENINDERRRTPRRVHFGGEIVKLRTPDSDETESIGAVTPRTRIPVPVSPATRMPSTVRRRATSQPCSPHLDRRDTFKRKSRSASNSPKREYHFHNAESSPKKSILIVEAKTKNRRASKEGKERINAEIQEGSIKAFQICSEDQLDDILLVQAPMVLIENDPKSEIAEEKSEPNEKENVTEEVDDGVKNTPKRRSSIHQLVETKQPTELKRSPTFDIFPRQERNYILMELSSPPLKSNSASKTENRHSDNTKSSETSGCDEIFGSLTENKDNLEEQNDNIESVTISTESDKIVLQKVETPVKPDRECDSGIAGERTGNGTSSSEGEDKPREASWEDLGLVDRDVLDDIHNKNDWRARVRGLERVASVLKTTSALIAIEPRLGSLLHAVLGGERSCRVAAAGMAVAKVVIAGVSQEALKRRLPQLAWGLARQGGPNAAQLARITMLRLKPALLLEQLLQPQCLNARNAKTRENALQLLIFSLVTFPSTEFEVDNVANKVAFMVADRRRRVRQAALDTLAVLAQIYEPEDVIQAGLQAAKNRRDNEAMISAIRARLARKSLPLVSADGLVVYGLQISPTVQIVTGPDVEWIVAGSGSVSPGTGRTRGQIIATTTEFQSNRISSNEKNPWSSGKNFIALGVGLPTENNHSVAWEIVARDLQNDTQEGKNKQMLENRKAENWKDDNLNINEYQLENKIRTYYMDGMENNKRSGNEYYGKEDAVEEITILEGVDKYFDSNIVELNKRKVNVLPLDLMQEESSVRSESRIPVPFNRERSVFVKSSNQVREKLSKKKLSEERIGYSNTSQRKKSIHSNAVSSATSSALRSREDLLVESNSDYGQRFIDGERFARTMENRLNRYQPSSEPRRIVQRSAAAANDSYVMMYQRQRKLIGEIPSRQLQTAPGPLFRVCADVKPQTLIKEKASNFRLSASAAQNTREFHESSQNNDLFRRRLRSLSPQNSHRRRKIATAVSSGIHTASMFNIDKTGLNEEEYNVRNKQNFSTESYQVQALSVNGLNNRENDSSINADGTSSDASSSHQERSISRNSGSSTPSRKNVDKAFDVITDCTNPLSQDTVDTFNASFDISKLASNSFISESLEDSVPQDASKDWSSEDEMRHQNRVTIQSVSPSTEENATITDESSDNPTSNAISFYADGSIHCDEEDDFHDAINTPNKLLSSESSCKNSEINEGMTPLVASRRNSHSSSCRFDVFENTEDSSGDASFQPTNPVVMSPARIHPASRPRSVEVVNEECIDSSPVVPETNIIQETMQKFASVKSRAFTPVIGNTIIRPEQFDDDNEETNNHPGILKIETHPREIISTVRRQPSRVPRSISKPRSNKTHTVHPEEKKEKLKPIVQQCFAQLENDDWEITMKGLKSLSQIAKLHPEYLDSYVAGTIGRSLGRHIKNLRSQVARTACQVAGEIFSTQIRGIEQDLDDLAGHLLHRTADTNRFLRADSNAALDRMVEHLPAHKSIMIVSNRGANHQNPIVRAATARLLLGVVDRVGTDHIMFLPREPRDKLLNTGAKLLMDGSLDARNNTKKMFRRLMRHENFQRVLMEAVPEATLRHIDKTLKSL